MPKGTLQSDSVPDQSGHVVDLASVTHLREQSSLQALFRGQQVLVHGAHRQQ